MSYLSGVFLFTMSFLNNGRRTELRAIKDKENAFIIQNELD